MEALVVFILFVMFPAVVFAGMARLRKAKGTAGVGEMRASELRSMISAAVETAVAGLAARVTDLEERLGDEPVAALRERTAAPRLDARTLSATFDPDADLDDADGRPVQRRARA